METGRKPSYLSEEVPESVEQSILGPIRRTEVETITIDGVEAGVFPSFQALPVKHGFSWGERSQNMAFKMHEGDPLEIIDRNQTFLNALGMPDLSRTVITEAYSTSDFTDITEEFLSSQESTGRGIFVPAHVSLTTLPDVAITLKPGDCTATFVSSLTAEGEALVGIVHAGRNEIANHLPERAVPHIREIYGSNLSDIHLGVVPSLGRGNHLIRAADIERVLGDISAWDGFSSFDENGDIYLDMNKFVVAQYLRAGVPSRNIEWYDVDTYQEAKNGQTFSHRYANFTNQPHLNGRMMLAIQVKV